MRSHLAIGVALGAVMLTGCSSAPSPTPTISRSSNPTTGTLTGTVREYGGPMNPTTGKMAMNGEPEQHFQVKVLSATQVVATQVSDAQGHFTFQLPPGTYTLRCEGTTPVTMTASTRVVTACDDDVP